ncbi:MAG: hypothetical protein Q7U72_07965 [Brevundimonas sp.]|uniref:hypothetical protein n=1 Tax=Brevundimonas sp. TaxID=1871086 RepID=UPI002720E0A6|nr:hypothetical protein [Brevundimonas sp.]MDO9077372.1 hypothetical protein [Brevundimonas sp.]MDZ4062735.1 hypothetical protein [Brevundimonas sp.]
MFPRNLLTLVGAVAALALTGAQPGFAQTVDNTTGGARSETARASGSITGERVTPGRVGGGRQAPAADNRATRQRAAPPPVAPTPEAIKAAAQALVVATGAACSVTEAAQPGINTEQQKIYEAACSEGPGLILIESTPPQSFDCLELAGTAYTARLRDPAADVGQQCVLPANQNGLAIIGGWARTAGATCTIDEAVAIGKTDADNIVYEIGCAGTDGYWLERVGTGWDLKGCLQVNSTGGICRFTTAQEQADGFEPKLAGTDAAACDVTQVRLMGSNANGRFYEAKCAAEGEGYIARIDNEGVTQQIYPCATAQRIGGGCRFTPAPALPPTE